MWNVECVWIIVASIGAFHTPSEQTSIVWEFPIVRPSVSIGEIRLTQPEVETIFIQGGYSKVLDKSPEGKKFCSTNCQNMEHCAKKLLSMWEKAILMESATPIFQTNEYVQVIKKSRFRFRREQVRVMFGDLTVKQKKELLLERVMDRQKIIQEWKRVTYKRRDEIYNTAVTMKQFQGCLKLWNKEGLVTNDECDLDKILQAIDVGHLSLTGSNGPQSTDVDSFLKVDAGQGIELEIKRLHTRFYSSFTSFMFLSMRGNVYKMSFEERHGSRGFFGSKVNDANPFSNNVGYPEVDKAYTSSLFARVEEKSNAKFVITGYPHDNNSRI